MNRRINIQPTALFTGTRSQLFYWLSLTSIYVLAVALKIPGLFNELPPYTFCDEKIFLDAAWQMYQSANFVTTEFKSGQLNSLPPAVLARAFSGWQSLSQLEFLIFGRILMTGIVGSLAIFPIAAATLQISRSRSASVIAGALVALSPFSLAMGRYWYPDHYLMTFAGLLAYSFIRAVNHNLSRSSVTFAGIAGGLAFSVKYTSAFFGVFILIYTFTLIFRENHQPKDFVRVYIQALKPWGHALIPAFATFMLINSSIFSNPRAFAEGFFYNLINYSGGERSIAGVVFYLFILLVLAIPGLGLIGLGFAKRANSRAITFPVVGLTVAAYIIFMGFQPLLINRNLSLVFPLFCILVGIGLKEIFFFRTKLIAGSKLVSALAYIVATLFVILNLFLVASNLYKDFKVDSRAQAQEYLKNTAVESNEIGTNEVCSGSSPAEAAGLKTTFDPDMTKELEVYVFNSYWPGRMAGAYRGEASGYYFWDQKYMHFYNFSDRATPSYFERAFQARPDLTPLIPKNYRLERVFSGSGPDVIVLRKNLTR